MVALVSVSGALLAAWYALAQPHIYISRASIMSRGAATGPALLGMIEPMSALSNFAVPDDSKEIRDFQVILRTDFMAHQVLEKQNLLTDLDLATLRRNFRTRIEGPLLHLQFTSHRADLAHRVVQGYLQELQNFFQNQETSQNRQAESFVGSRLRDLATQVDEVEARLTALRGGSLRPQAPRSIQTEIMRAEREFQRLTKLNDMLVQQETMSHMDAQREKPHFMVVETPQGAESPAGPDRLLLTVAGALLAVFGSLVFMQSRRKWRDLMHEIA